MGHAWSGLRFAYSGEANFRWHLLALLVSGIAGWALELPLWKWIALIVIWGLVLAVELLNTAVEKLADVVQPEHDERIRKVKDLSAGAVLLVAIAATIAGAGIFGQEIRERSRAKTDPACLDHPGR